MRDATSEVETNAPGAKILLNLFWTRNKSSSAILYSLSFTQDELTYVWLKAIYFSLDPMPESKATIFLSCTKSSSLDLPNFLQWTHAFLCLAVNLQHTI